MGLKNLVLYIEKSRKKYIKKLNDVIEVNWFKFATKIGIKGTNYDKLKFTHKKTLFNLSCKYTKFGLRFK